ncbi:MAG: dodecin family protein [Melioribacteraceae bacterium]|nr:dodecin family protein [Melioribacteraceae bacterium]
MSIVKVIELIAESDKSWEDATKNALTEAQKTVKNIESIYIKDMKAIVKGGDISKYRVNAKVSFRVGD